MRCQCSAWGWSQAFSAWSFFSFADPKTAPACGAMGKRPRVRRDLRGREYLANL